MAVDATVVVYITLFCGICVLTIYICAFILSLDDQNFASRSWKKSKAAATSVSHFLCPFTGKEPNIQCPCCSTIIHSDAFHSETPFKKGWVMGEGPCLWRQARVAMDRNVSAAVRRVLLDEAFFLRSNFLLGGVGDACVGCVTWMRSFQVLPKLSITLITYGIFASLLPFAFHHLTHSIISRSDIFYAFLDGYALLCGVGSILVMTHSLHLVRQFYRTFPVTFPFSTYLTMS